MFPISSKLSSAQERSFYLVLCKLVLVVGAEVASSVAVRARGIVLGLSLDLEGQSSCVEDESALLEVVDVLEGLGENAGGAKAKEQWSKDASESHIEVR